MTLFCCVHCCINGSSVSERNPGWLPASLQEPGGEAMAEKRGRKRNQLIPFGKFGSLPLSFKALVWSAEWFAVGIIKDIFFYYITNATASVLSQKQLPVAPWTGSIQSVQTNSFFFVVFDTVSWYDPICRMLVCVCVCVWVTVLLWHAARWQFLIRRRVISKNSLSR